MRWVSTAPEDRTLGIALRDQAELIGDNDFLMDQTSRMTYSQVNARVNACAHSLADLGVSKGDTVIILMGNCADMVVIALAVSKLGAIWVPLNTALKGDWMSDVIRRTRATTLVGHSGLFDLVDFTEVPGLDTVVFIGDRPTVGTDVRLVDFEELLLGPEAELNQYATYRDPAAIMWTSGTTGLPKGVIQTHSSWLLGSTGLSSFRGFESGDVLYCCLPMFNSGGWTLNVFAALVAGLPIGIDPTFSASRFWDRCINYGATQIVTLGAMADFLLQADETPAERAHSVRVAACIPISPDAEQRFTERFGIEKTWTGYAQSEFLYLFGRHAGEQLKPGSSGKANDNVQIGILDEFDRILPTGEVGEICARPLIPDLMFGGYFDQPELTLNATRNLWYHTGDLGYLDEDGELFFADRKSDLIRFAGRTVSAAEVERAALAHPDIMQAAAFGVPSEQNESESEVMLSVVASESLTPDELARFINENSPHYLVPRYIDIVSELPTTPTGKIEKRTLKDTGKTADTWDRVAAGFKIEKKDSWAL